MATISQVRAVLLEEAVLCLLDRAGFVAVEHVGNDPTLEMGPAGLHVRGRGSSHQADALADYRVSMPFGHPQRLMAEAKCFSRDPVRLEVIRNAVGILKDISEFFVPASNPKSASCPRYHYQYAVFSATNFTVEAQQYAYAHDIGLIPLGASNFMSPIIRTIKSVDFGDLNAPTRNKIEIDLKSFRAGVRRALRRTDQDDRSTEEPFAFSQSAASRIRELSDIIRYLGGSLLARANRRFLLHLVPRDRGTLAYVAETQPLRVRVFYEGRFWYLEDSLSGRRLFSFDLPEELFLMYADSGVLSPQRAADLKQQELSELEALYWEGSIVQHIRLELDQQWLERVRSGLERKRRIYEDSGNSLRG